MTIKFHQVRCGDAITISNNDKENPVNIVIDGGYIGTYLQCLKAGLNSLPGKKANLWILTHLDADHINGMVAFLRDPKMVKKFKLEEVWLNCFDHFEVASESTAVSVGKAMEIRDKLLENETSLKCNLINRTEWEKGSLSVDVLSPDLETFNELKIHWEEELERYKKPVGEVQISKKDSDDYDYTIDELAAKKYCIENSNDITNKSSIAFILKDEKKSILFLGDAPASKIVSALEQRLVPGQRRFFFDYVKLAHHGSRYNISKELLGLINCSCYVISGDGLAGHYLPDKETLAKILCHDERNKEDPIEFIFNYDNAAIRSIFKIDKDRLKEYNFTVRYPKAGKRYVEL